MALPWADASASLPLRWLVCCVLLVLLARWLYGHWIDQIIFSWLTTSGAEAAPLWSALAVVGLGSSALLLIACAPPSKPFTLASLVLALITGGVALQLLQALWPSPQPTAMLAPASFKLIGQALANPGLPSGHAALAAAVAVILLRRPGLVRQVWMMCGIVALTLAVVLSYVAIGSQWPSDVLAGVVLGGCTGQWVATTPSGQLATERLVRAMTSRVGSRWVATVLVMLSTALWVTDRDPRLASWLCDTLPAIGLWGAWRWWQLHPGHSQVSRHRRLSNADKPGLVKC